MTKPAVGRSSTFVISLLNTLLAFSLAVIIVGFLLSYKPGVRSQYAVSTAVRARRAVERQSLHTDHVPVEVERRAGLYISKQVAVERISGQGLAGKAIPWKVITVGLVALFLLSL